ncbi:MAG: aryl-sulfate sulfotransferase [Planctomycetota bacterium]
MTRWYAAVVAALAVTPALAQGPAPGHRLVSVLGRTDTGLVDAQGAIVHTWSAAFPPGLSCYLDRDGTLLRTAQVTTSPLPGQGGGLQRLALDGSVLWDFRYDGPGVLSHHDIAVLPNGHVLMVAWEDMTFAEAVAAGRDPATIPGVLWPDHVIEVQQTGPTTGAIVWEWHAWDHLIQDFDPTKANFGVVSDHPELIDLNYPPLVPPAGDWLHFNGIDYDPVHDRIVISVNSTGEIWVIDHSTTTQEAAGHVGGRWGRGGDLLYRWGNPAAYGRGTVLERVSNGQHSPKFIPPGDPGAGNLMLFLNSPRVLPQSAVYEITPPLDPSGAFILAPGGTYGPAAPTWSYTDPSLFSKILSSVERLPNGNTLICSGTEGRVFEVTPSGVEVAAAPPAAGPVFHATYVDRTLWSDRATLSVAAGGAVGLDLVAGSASAGDPYLVLGSVSGTMPGTALGGVHVPLNFDAWTVQTASFPGTPLLQGTLGTLDANGRATASLLNVPPGLLPGALIGLALDHAFVVVDAGGAPTLASNAVGFVLAP